MERVRIAIVGSGPAGVSTAAALVKARPELAGDMLILEKAKHPRPKLCGGGLTPWADERLADLDLETGVPTFRVNRVAFYFNDEPLYFDRQNLMRTIRRDEFDAAMVERIREKGVRVREKCAVQDVRLFENGVKLATTTGEVFCDTLIGADGAKGIVRRKLFREEESRVSRLMEVLVKVSGRPQEFAQKMAVFDFREISNALQGYMWDFPCWIKGEPFLNVGVFDSRILAGPRAQLRDLLRRRLESRGVGVDEITYMGHPERWYHPRRKYSFPRVLLVGDAAGIEPWLGEGISFALGYGSVAAEATLHAFETNDFRFADYAKRINRSPIGRALIRNRLIAKYFYRPRRNIVLPLFEKALSWHVARKHNVAIKHAPRLELET